MDCGTRGISRGSSGALITLNVRAPVTVIGRADRRASLASPPSPPHGGEGEADES